MKRIMMGLIAVLAIFSLGCQQQLIGQPIDSSLCELANDFNIKYEDMRGSGTVHTCVDEEGKTVYHLEENYEYGSSDTYYSAEGKFLYKKTQDDTGTVHVYDEQNNVIEQGEYSTLTIPKYECNEVNIC